MATYSYTYYIAWTKLDKHYYGVRHAKHCHPNELWVTYFTSSKHVKKFRSIHGEPDVVEVRKTFADAKSARLWEAKVLKRIQAAQSERWINKHNGNGEFCCYQHTEETKQKFRSRPKESFAMFGKYGEQHQRYGKKHTDEWKARQKIRSKAMAAGRRWYTNGDANKWLRPEVDNIPAGFRPGRTLRREVESHLSLQAFLS